MLIPLPLTKVILVLKMCVSKDQNNKIIIIIFLKRKDY